ncbi:MAG: pilus assembly protein PilM [Deltaproteobacteria bacterium]|nr:pilus assembly protein PilM [Deltaproteobacteria bacterium]
MLTRKAKGPAREPVREKRVAIDLGLYSIKFAYFKDKRLALDEFPLFDQPKDLKDIAQKEISDSQMSVINKAVSMIDPKAEFIITPQPSLQGLTRVFQHPADIDIKRYLDKEMPFDPDLYSFDSYRIDELTKNKKSKKSAKKSSRIAVSVAELDFIQRSIGLLGEYQLQIKQFTPNLVTLLNYLLLISDSNESRPVVFLDLGSLYTHLIVYGMREKFLSRTIELGGTHFNRELVQKLNVDYETAERIKTERKLIDDGLFDSKGASTSMPMFQAINSILFRLVDEIKISMTYFEDTFLEDLSDAHILMAGGTSHLQNLDRFLTKEIGLPVQRVESAVHPLIPQQAFAPQFATTIGLLGSRSRNDLFNINLLNNIEGLLFKLDDGDYYLTKEGFVNKKKYKRKQKSNPLKPTVVGKKSADTKEPTLAPLAIITSLLGKILALIKGEEFEMREIRISFDHVDMASVKGALKNLIVVFGALFIVIYIGHHFFWSAKKKGLDRDINGYLSRSTELDRTRGTLIMGGPKVQTTEQTIKITHTDKILWANKLRAIAAAIPERVWVSDLTIQGAPPALILSCHVYSFGEDHLKDIALFIENLKRQTGFLKDFKDAIFHSALRNATDRDIYDFTLTFPLNRTMIQEISEPVVKREG